MRRCGARILRPVAAFALLFAPQVASAQHRHGDYGHRDPAYRYDAPPPSSPPAYARGYDAPSPGWRSAQPGRRGDQPPPPRRVRCDRGTAGTILGAIAGGLLGNGIAGRGDRSAGTIIGAGVGALTGREIDRDC